MDIYKKVNEMLEKIQQNDAKTVKNDIKNTKNSDLIFMYAVLVKDKDLDQASTLKVSCLVMDEILTRMSN